MKKIVLTMVKGYQKRISPLFPPTCRYYPTCSNYAVQAIETHGALKGSVMAAARITRCNPFVEGGVDKVPDHFSVKRNPATKSHVYLGNGITVAPDDVQYTQNEIENLLERYKEKTVIQKTLPSTAECLNRLTDAKEQSIGELPDAYIAMIKKQLVEEEYFPSLVELEKTISLRFYSIVKNEKSRSYYAHVHPNPISQEHLNGETVFCLVEESIGMLDTNSPKLREDFVLTSGITQKDIDEQTPHLFEYLLVLKGKHDHGHHAH